MLMKHPVDRAEGIANLFHNLPDRETRFIEPHSFLGILRRNPWDPEFHAFILEETAKPTPLDAIP